jgi:hypothetical protein
LRAAATPQRAPGGSNCRHRRLNVKYKEALVFNVKYQNFSSASPVGRNHRGSGCCNMFAISGASHAFTPVTKPMIAAAVATRVVTHVRKIRTGTSPHAEPLSIEHHKSTTMCCSTCYPTAHCTCYIMIRATHSSTDEVRREKGVAWGTHLDTCHTLIGWCCNTLVWECVWSPELLTSEEMLGLLGISSLGHSCVGVEKIAYLEK